MAKSSGSRDSERPEEALGPVALFLRSRSGGAAKTVQTYGERLAQYTRWRGGETIDRAAYDDYIAERKRRGRRPNGIALDARVLLLYARFNKIDTDGWQRLQLREVPTSYLRENEINLLRAALAASPRDGPDRVFLLDFLLGTGLRLQEFTSLRWRDIDLEEGRVVVRSGKGGKTRTIPIPWEGPPELVRALEAAQQMFWRKYPEKTLAEGRLVTDYVWAYREAWRIENLVKAAAKRAGLSGVACHPHILRHTFATRLTVQGAPQAIVQRLLGHSSPATTARYQNLTAMDIVAELTKIGTQSRTDTGKTE